MPRTSFRNIRAVFFLSSSMGWVPPTKQHIPFRNRTKIINEIKDSTLFLYGVGS
ncbi:MAG: hypothetical protein QXI48_02770 [Candidatus Bathyarchaeia archaeon]